tara:strand:+ start:80 stop:1339 length:1260 start_codon:yes stop_codon:yes gene_type:complete
MNKLFLTSLVSSTILFGANSAKADWDYWGFINQQETINNHIDSFIHLKTINSYTGEETFIKRWCGSNSCRDATGLPILKSTIDIAYPQKHIDKDTIILREYETDTSSEVLHKKYNLSGNTFTGETISNNDAKVWYQDYSYTAIRGAAQIDADGNLYSDIGGQLWMKHDSSGTISFGKTGSSTPFYSLSTNGLSQGGTNLISRSADGVTSIGANSLKLQEKGGFQKMWATEESGKSIPIDITNGSKLLINGRDVEQSINNVGALSAALTGLPTVPTDTTLACGLGTGTHGGDFALSGGCASKVNEKLSINYAASVTVPGQDYAGDFEDKFSARAGFVWKLGKSLKPTQISSNQKKGIDLKISKLQNDNELLKADNKELKNKNNKIISQNEKLLARLEKLENIAFKLQKNDELKLSQGILE